MIAFIRACLVVFPRRRLNSAIQLADLLRNQLSMMIVFEAFKCLLLASLFVALIAFAAVAASSYLLAKVLIWLFGPLFTTPGQRKVLSMDSRAFVIEMR